MTYTRPATLGAEPNTEILSFNFSDQFSKLIIIDRTQTYLKFQLSVLWKSDAMDKVVPVSDNTVFGDFPK